MFAIVVINSQDQDPAIAMYSAMNELGWNNDEKIPFTFWKELDTQEQVEDDLKIAIVNADWEPFDYLVSFSENEPTVSIIN